MSDPTNPLSKFVPGFDFLQGLVRNAGAALPGVGQWIAPSLDPEELEKRIEELRTVQFWLEQNARVLGGTIQALEVQRMTLSTLKTMNVSLGDLTESLKIRMPEPAAAPAPAPAPAPRSPFSFGGPPAAEPAAPPPAAAPAPKAKPRARQAAAGGAPEVPTGVVDPMQWWGALTKQFTEIAANTLKDSASDAAKNLAGAMVKQGVDAASDTLKKAAAMPGQMAHSAAATAQQVAEAAAEAAGKAAGTAMGLAGAAGQAASKRKAGGPARKRQPATKP